MPVKDATADAEETPDMDDTTAADIIKSFATTRVSATVDPSALSADDVQDAGPGADLAQALFLAAEALESRARLAARRQAALPRNAGKPWSAAEDEQLLQAYDAGSAIEAIATLHERTRAGIEARLVKHGRIDEQAARGGQGLRYPARDRPPPR
jgi:hypothetical protein